MKKSFIFSLCVAAIALSSCSTYQYTARQTSINRQDIQTTPTVVDVRTDYSKRIDVTSDWRMTKEDAMNECRYLAITNNKIDVVVDPIFKVEYRYSKIKNRYKASLTGFAGYYVNPRLFFEDIDAVKKFSREEIENYLLLHNPEILKYLNAQDEVINIYHGPQPPKKCEEAQPAPIQEEPAKPAATQNKRK